MELPRLIYRLTYRRKNHGNLHVRGYKEEGSTTTPFDMTVRNDMDRFHLVMDVIDRVPHLETRMAYLKQAMLTCSPKTGQFHRGLLIQETWEGAPLY